MRFALGVVLASAGLLGGAGPWARAGAQAPAAGPDTAQVRAEIERLERGWARANITRDTAYVAGILADDFVFPTDVGGVVGKHQVLAAMRASRDSITATRLDGLRVRILRPDLALAEGLYVETGRRAGSGAPYRFAVASTDVLERRQGRW